MAESYPKTVQFDKTGQIIAFEVGLQVTVRAGTFNQAFECTIDKLDGQDVAGDAAVTDVYVIKDFVDPQTGGAPDPLPPLADKTIFLHIPTLVQTTVQTALTLHNNPGEEHPHPDQWIPDPDVDIDSAGPGKLHVGLPSLKTFQILG